MKKFEDYLPENFLELVGGIFILMAGAFLLMMGYAALHFFLSYH